MDEIDPVFIDTPSLPCAPLGDALGCSVTLKIETLNPARSFKGRGTETVAAVARQEQATRMVCASAGNLGQALAYSGARRGLPVTVVAAQSASPLKLRRIAALGARCNSKATTSKTPEPAHERSRWPTARTSSRTASTSPRAKAPPR